MKKIIIFLFITVWLSSCQDWLDVNTNPNEPSTATLEQIYPSGVASVVSVVGGDYAILGGFWSQYFTQNVSSNQYKNIDSYNLIGSDFNADYTELYTGALNDFKYVRTHAEETQNWSYYLMATVVDCYTWQVLVDLYGEIPFSEADRGNEVLNGASVDVLSPHYEKGQDIYDSLIARLNVALSKNLNNTQGGILTSEDPTYNDFIFGKDLSKSFSERMTLWRQFANTLKLKIFLRECYARPAVSQAGIQSMVSDPNFDGFLTTDAKFDEFSDEADKSNPFYESNIRELNTKDNIKASQTLLDTMMNNNDTLRLAHLYSTVGGQYAGLPQGDFADPSISGSSLSGFIQSPTDPVYFISAAESYFLQAEAVLRGYMSGDAQTLYNDGVMAAFAQWSEDGTNYLATQAQYPSGGTFDDQLRAIITQKWISMAGTHGLEAFFERNRTHIPDFFTFAVNAVTNSSLYQYPRRLILPETEKERNKNAPTDNKAIYDPVWWDVKPGNLK